MRRLVLAIALSGLGVAWPALAEPIAPMAFRDRLAAAVSTATGRPVIVVDDRTFKTRAADGTELTASIDNAYAEYLAHPAEIDAILARYAATLTMPQDQAEPIDQLIVIVRPSDYLTRSLPAGASQEHFLAGRPMAGDLSYFLAVDSPTAIRTASKSDLARWMVDEATAWQKAIANIKGRVGPVAIVHLGDANGPSGLGADSGLAPSVLADPAFCGPSALDGMNGQVILLYSRDSFLFTVPADVEMSRKFWRVTKVEVAAGRSLSATPLTCRAGKWTVATAPAF